MSDIGELIAIRQLLERLVGCAEAQMDHDQLRRADALARVRRDVRRKLDEDYLRIAEEKAEAATPKRWMRKG